MNEKIEEIRISDVETINKVKALLQEHRQNYKGKKITEEMVIQGCVKFVYNKYDFEER